MGADVIRALKPRAGLLEFAGLFGLVVLFVGADVLVLWLWNRRRRLRAAVT